MALLYRPGDPAKPYENEAMRKAGQTWGGDFFKNGGGGSVWDGMAYDPDFDLIYVGTGMPNLGSRIPRREDMDNLYTCSILAVNVTTGVLKWHYQAVPNDNWDYDAVQQLMLADLTIKGKTRKVLMQAFEERLLLCAGSPDRRVPQRRSLRAGELGERFDMAVRS